jgi:hypothetical protein
MNNLVSVPRNQGKYEQAEEMLRQVLGLREAVLGKEHPGTPMSMNNLATVRGNKASTIRRKSCLNFMVDRMYKYTSSFCHNSSHTVCLECWAEINGALEVQTH